MLEKLVKALEPGERRSLRVTRKGLLYFQCLIVGAILAGGIYVHHPRYDWREVQPRKSLQYHDQQMRNACMVDGRFSVERYKTFIINYPNRTRRYEFRKTPSFHFEVPLADALIANLPQDAMTREEREELDCWMNDHKKELGLTRKGS